MKNKLFIALCLSLALTACNKDKSEVAPTLVSTPKASSAAPHYAHRTTGDENGSQFISTDIANQMISSYLYSIGNNQNNGNPFPNDVQVKSFSVDADMLREYLADPNVANIKLMLAHTSDYAKSDYGKYAGYKVGALTIVIAAYDSNGDYIFHGGEVLDHCAPCPFSCPPGTAGSELLQ